MKQQQLLQILLVTGFVWLGVAIGATAQPVPSLEVQSKSVGRILRDSSSTRNLPRLNELERPLTSAQMLVQSPAPATVPAPAVVQVTGVQANPTEKGVEVILQTTLGEQLQVVDRSADNSYIADIPNAQLRLPNGNAFVFRSQKPITGITEITVTNADANTIRVTVTGEAGVPTVELFDSPEEGLIFGVVSAAALSPPQQQPPTQPTPQGAEPESETEPDEPSAEGEEEIEIVVTGEQETGYRVPDASTATKTDTPLRDIPQSIQVIPQEVIRDQNITRVEDALRNVSGVTPTIPSGSTPFSGYTIRGFATSDFTNNVLRDGLQDPRGLGGTRLTNIERIELLRGPASVLFGSGSPGGTINLITKKPLSDPFYEISASVGSYDFYQSAIDLSGPLNDSKTVLYRLNASYSDAGSSRDFIEIRNIVVAPVLSWAISKNTNLTLQGEFNDVDNVFETGPPALGTVLSNPNGRIARNFNAGEPNSKFSDSVSRVGYRIDHTFSGN